LAYQLINQTSEVKNDLVIAKTAVRAASDKKQELQAWVLDS